MSTVFETQEGDHHYEEVVDFINQLIATELARLTESSDPQAAATLKEKEGFKNFSATAKKALRDRQYEEFIKQILSAAEFFGRDSRCMIFLYLHDANHLIDYTSVFQVLGALICRLAQNEKDQTRLAQPIVDFAMKNTKCSVSMRFKALAILFNFATSYPTFRFEVLKNIFQLALNTNKASVILNHLTNLQGHCDTLKLDFKQEAELYKVALKLVDTLEEKK